MHILLTGGAGSAGTRLRDALADSGAVRVFDRAPVDRDETVQGDVRDYEAVRDAVESVDVVVHAAAMTGIEAAEDDPVACFGVNTVGTFNVCRAAREAGIERVVYLSSREVYGENPDASEDAPLAPGNVYGESKRLAEILVRELLTDPLILRPTNLFGMGSDFVSHTADAVREGEEVTLYEAISLDLLHVDDFARIVAWMVENDVGGVFNVGSGQQFSMPAVVEAIEEALETEADIVPAETPQCYTETFGADVTKLERVLPFAIPDQAERIRDVARDRAI